MMEFGKRDPAIEYIERTGAYAIIQDDFQAIAVIRTPAGYFYPAEAFVPMKVLTMAWYAKSGKRPATGPSFLRVSGLRLNLRTPGTRAFTTERSAHFFLARLTERVTKSVEADHELLWQSTADAIKNMTHEYHAWAVQEALRSL